MQLIKEFIEKNVSYETKLVLAKKFSNQFDPPTPFNNVTCDFMYRDIQNMFSAYVLGYIHGKPDLKQGIRGMSTPSFHIDESPFKTVSTLTETTEEEMVQLQITNISDRVDALEQQWRTTKIK